MSAIATETRVPQLRCYWLEARSEFLRVLRAPAFAVPTLVFPPMFYLLFGVLLNGGHGKATSYLLATFGVFGVMAPGLFGFGVAMALDRERGFLALKRALPTPPGAMLLAKMAMAMVFAVMISIILMTIALTLGKVTLAPGQLLEMTLVNVLGVLPFCAIGLYIGTVVSGQGAPAVINILYLPMAFLAGLWMPLSMLPPLFAKLAPLWPAYHLAQIALSVVGLDDGGRTSVHVLVLAAVSGLFFLLARRRLARG
ncbi:ABC transporter permease [Cognatiluteimonas telluris]|uniref:ABC transporter permease n=1 Tax=Cognatiluteimonas telluris TaxID=1104775 RepID=UPI00140E3D6F|nr:ABC transporter permease [Lysobacter telluris]